MDLLEKPTLLAIGVAGLRLPSATLDVYTASSIREAMATIRLFDFDLLLVGLDAPNLNVWELMRRVLAAWPQQRWLLTSENITAKEEILGRSLGALMVLDKCPDDYWLGDFVASLRAQVRSRRFRHLEPADNSLVTAHAPVVAEAT
jgi:DNA-binding response OmpR family regulator